MSVCVLAFLSLCGATLNIPPFCYRDFLFFLGDYFWVSARKTLARVCLFLSFYICVCKQLFYVVVDTRKMLARCFASWHCDGKNDPHCLLLMAHLLFFLFLFLLAAYQLHCGFATIIFIKNIFKNTPF